MEDKTKGMGLGVDLDASMDKNGDLYSTFVPPIDTNTQFEKMMEVLIQGVPPKNPTPCISSQQK